MHAIWKKLEGLSFLFTKIVNMKYQEGNSIAEHLNVMNYITNLLASMKTSFDDAS